MKTNLPQKFVLVGGVLLLAFIWATAGWNQAYSWEDALNRSLVAGLALGALFFVVGTKK